MNKGPSFIKISLSQTLFKISVLLVNKKLKLLLGQNGTCQRGKGLSLKQNPKISDSIVLNIANL